MIHLLGVDQDVSELGIQILLSTRAAELKLDTLYRRYRLKCPALIQPRWYSSGSVTVRGNSNP